MEKKEEEEEEEEEERGETAARAASIKRGADDAATPEAFPTPPSDPSAFGRRRAPSKGSALVHGCAPRSVDSVATEYSIIVMV